MEKTPRVLLVYYTHTQQAKRVADVLDGSRSVRMGRGWFRALVLPCCGS